MKSSSVANMRGKAFWTCLGSRPENCDVLACMDCMPNAFGFFDMLIMVSEDIRDEDVEL